MKTIDGYDVKIFTDNIEDTAIEQIRQLLSIDVFSDCKIRIMPDVHAGAGCVIGFTGNLGNKVIPNIVGVDIGCGMLVQPFTCNNPIDFHALNEYIIRAIPSGRDFRDENYLSLPEKYSELYREAKHLTLQLRCYRELKEVRRLYKSIGSLGSGNHFIEMDRDESGLYYLVVHTGSRNLGKQVADIYQKLAVKCQSGWDKLMEEKNRIIAEYKQAGRKSELQDVIRNLHNSFKTRKLTIPQDLCYLEGQFLEDYLHDMRICQRWAQINRKLIVNMIMDFMVGKGLVSSGEYFQPFESVHNYIGDDNIIRKGAISARLGEKCIIPLNMRDGSLICIGKGNEDWNYSAPHGAGRIMSRSQAFKEISLEDFKKSMKDVYSETVTEYTKDESPMVYKSKYEIMDNIKDTVDIETMIKPVFNVIRNLHNSFKTRKLTIPQDLCYLEGQFLEDYLHDMRICQRWAQINRKLIVNMIMDFMVGKGLVSSGEYFQPFESVHNYIGDDNIIRKGAISARLGEKCIIPLNMRDGSLICIGKGNEDWNYSAPHGAGRIMSRSQAFKEISLEDFKKSMKDVYSETVTEYTKDESPMVYKSKYEIMDNIKDTVDIETMIKPVFNFKAADI